MASEKNINLKKEEVSKLAEQMKEAKLILLTDYILLHCFLFLFLNL